MIGSQEAFQKEFWEVTEEVALRNISAVDKRKAIR
jgi:hypothetical protein